MINMEDDKLENLNQDYINNLLQQSTIIPVALKKRKAETDDNDEPLIKTKKFSPNKKPKKRLNYECTSSTALEKSGTNKFIYGNYNRYYGYRNNDVRMSLFDVHKEIFKNKNILDVGCNSGLITMEISKRYDIKFIYGIDIDKSLINQAKKFIVNKRKSFNGRENDRNKFPFNIEFICCNYVVQDDVLLEIEHPQFDLILCLSVTKWIHLNFGDAGLKQAFRRMFKQLHPGGKLILEPQPWNGYKRRKKLTPEIAANYSNIKFFPKDFNEYLLGPEVGFSEMYKLGIPENIQNGFKRPIYVYVKNI